VWAVQKRENEALRPLKERQETGCNHASNKRSGRDRVWRRRKKKERRERESRREKLDHYHFPWRKKKRGFLEGVESSVKGENGLEARLPR